MKELKNKNLYHQKGFSQKTKNRRSPYIKGDCCYGCEYPICPIRPDKPFEMKRPDCAWSRYLNQ